MNLKSGMSLKDVIAAWHEHLSKDHEGEDHCEFKNDTIFSAMALALEEAGEILRSYSGGYLGGDAYDWLKKWGFPDSF